VNLHAGILFQSAVAWSQPVSASTEGIDSRRQALAGILFAAISAETFMNEFEFIAGSHVKHFGTPRWLGALSVLLEEAENSHATVLSKYQLAKFILSGETFPKGATPFQDFALLVEIRNLIVHGKSKEAIVEKNDSGDFVWTNPKIMQKLEGAKLVKLDTSFLSRAAEEHNVDRFVTDVLDELTSQTTAMWACTSAAGMVYGILDAVPNDFPPFKHSVETSYRHAFTI
jgi:hypothetical protein